MIKFPHIALLLASYITSLHAEVASTSFVRWALNERVLYRVNLINSEPTTIRFPGKIQTIDGVGVCTGKENEMPGYVLLAFTNGSNAFTVRGLVKTGKASINVTYNGKTYAFDFLVSSNSSIYRCIEMYANDYRGKNAKNDASKPTTSSIAGLLSMINTAKAYDLLARQQPKLVDEIERYTPNTTQMFGVSGEVECVLSEVFRFSKDGSLVFNFKLVNKGVKEFSYVPHPTKLGIRVGDLVLASNVCDASGIVAPLKESSVFLVISGDFSRTGMDLTKNQFQLLLSEPQYGVVVKNG